MGVQGRYNFSFEIGARAASGAPQAIPSGWYQLQLVVIRKSLKDVVGHETENPWDLFVTSTSTFLHVNGGSIEETLPLRFNDVRDAATKHHLFVELIPLNEECKRETGSGTETFSCLRLLPNGRPDIKNSQLEPKPGIKTYLFEMPFMPYMAIPGKRRSVQNVSEQELPFNDQSLSLYVARARAYQSRKRLKQVNILNSAEYAAEQRLPLRSIDDASFANVRGLFEQLLSQKAIGNLKPGPSFAPLYSALCEELTAANKERQNIKRLNPSLAPLMNKAFKAQLARCAANPQEFIRLTRVTHLGKPILSEVKRIFQKPLNYTLMSNYMSNRMTGIDAVKGINISLKIPQIPFVSEFLEQIGLGVSSNHTVNYVDSRSQAETGIASMSDSLDFNYHAMRIPVLGSQACLEVRAVQSMTSMTYDRTPGATNGMYICAPYSDEKIVVNEVYANIYERCRETASTDCDNFSQSINVSMRGDREMSQFFYQVRKGVVPDHNNLVIPFGDMQSAGLYFANTPVSGQMQVVNPVEFPHDVIPSYWDRISGKYKENFKN